MLLIAAEVSEFYQPEDLLESAQSTFLAQIAKELESDRSDTSQYERTVAEQQVTEVPKTNTDPKSKGQNPSAKVSIEVSVLTRVSIK